MELDFENLNGTFFETNVAYILTNYLQSIYDGTQIYTSDYDLGELSSDIIDYNLDNDKISTVMENLEDKFNNEIDEYELSEIEEYILCEYRISEPTLDEINQIITTEYLEYKLNFYIDELYSEDVEMKEFVTDVITSTLKGIYPEIDDINELFTTDVLKNEEQLVK